MTKSFDPYHKWLGIPPEEQPPHHYRLLGIGLFESDPDVIEGAADRQMAHVQTHKTGPNTTYSQQLLNELAAAKLCLLDPAKKLAYDEELKARLAAKAPPAAIVAPVRHTRQAAAQPSVVAVMTAPPPGDAPPAAVVAPLPARVIAAPAVDAAIEQEPQPQVAVSTATGRGSAGLTYRRKRSSPVPLIIGILAVGVGAVFALYMFFGPSNDGQVAVQNGTGPTIVRPGNQSTAGGASHPTLGSKAVRPGGAAAGTSPPLRNDPGTSSSGGTTPDGSISAGNNSAGGSSSGNINSSGQDNSQPRTSVDPSSGGFPSTSSGGLSELLNQARGTATPENRLAVPDSAAVTQAKKTVRELYKFDYQKATTQPKKFELAGKLFNQAKQTNDDATLRYVLLTEAREYAIEAGVPIAAVEAADALTRLYALDGLQAKTDALVEAFRKASVADAIEAAAKQSGKLVDEAVSADEYDTALRVIQIGTMAAARMTKDKAKYTKEFSSRKTEVLRLQSLHEAYARSLKVLERDPDDPDACEAVGKFLCLVRSNWQLGLPLLEKSKDPALAKLAKLETSAPTSSNAQVELGDGWHALAESLKENHLLRARALIRARHWFRQAEPNLGGVTKLRVQQLIQQIRSDLDKAELSPEMLKG
jgi:hypothetical protein